MTTREEKLEALAAAARTGNAQLLKLAMADLDGPRLEIKIAGERFSRADIDELIRGINAAIDNGVRLH